MDKIYNVDSREPAVKENDGWKLDNGTWGTWEETKASILGLSGDPSGRKVYQALEIADEFANGVVHSIAWQWKLDDNHIQDTEMGNDATKGDITAKISVKVTARQVQEITTGLLDGDGQTFNSAMPTNLTFRSAAPIAELERVYNITDGILRSIIVALEK